MTATIWLVLYHDAAGDGQGYVGGHTRPVRAFRQHAAAAEHARAEQDRAGGWGRYEVLGVTLEDEL